MKIHIPLHKIAYARTGDKFNTSIIDVFPHNPEHKSILREELSSAFVEGVFGGICRGQIERKETPWGFTFILHAALDGGVVSSMRRDKHGKSLSGCMLQACIQVEKDIYDQIRRDEAYDLDKAYGQKNEAYAQEDKFNDRVQK